MNKLQASLTLIVAVMLFLSACKEDVNQVTIEFEEPTAGEVVANAAQVHIHVHFTATKDLEEIVLKLHPDGDASDLIIDLDRHVHEVEYVFEQDVDLSSYPSGTVFHLEAEVCIDHDCSAKESGDIEFSIP
ncbi:MAG: hypothetical protein OHK0039_06980 [Bacteroidia bacterium]